MVKIYEVPQENVPGIFGTCFLLSVLLIILAGVFYHLDQILDIPATPQRVVLKTAYIYKEISRSSKTTSILYVRVGVGVEAYDYFIEAFSKDVQKLGLRKSQKLWVAAEQEPSKRFVWGVYDEDLALLISRQDIIKWTRSSNFVNYSIAFSWGVLSLFQMFMLCKYGIWNRIVERAASKQT